MVAPEPFHRPRGTPFSVLHRIEGLTSLGHRVHLVTYPFGETPEIPGLEVERAPGVPGVRDVPVGPSFAKLMLDVPLFRRAYRTARRGDFDLLHTHEEAAVMGGWIAERCGLRHLYDMHSCLPEQMANFRRFDLPPVVALFRGLERYALDRAHGVIAISPSLAEHVREVGYAGPVRVIENVMAGVGLETSEEEVRALRRRLADDATALVVYTGTLEPYQGIELLLAAAGTSRGRGGAVRFVVVGGTESQVGELRDRAVAEGVDRSFTFVPAVPAEEVPAFLGAADVLVSPRRSGTNPPLKIYQYLRAGKPIVATDVPSHTQVLDPTTAEMVAPEPVSIARGIERVLSDPGRARELAENAGRMARTRYGEEAYLEGLSAILDAVCGRG